MRTFDDLLDGLEHLARWNDEDEVARAKAAIRSVHSAALAELKALRKDAEIYRWLRKQHAWWLLKHFPAQRPYVEAADVLDEAIAVAMAAKEIK